MPPLPRPGRPGRRARRLAFGASAGVAIVLAALLVWRTAYATFAGSAPAIGVTVSSGTVALADDSTGTAVFSLSGLAPGAAATRCVAVTSTGSSTAVVRLYGTGVSGSGSLGGYLNLSVLAGTGGGSGTCGSFTPDTTVFTGTLSSLPSGYGTGAGSWTTTGSSGETRTYQITASIPASAPASAQGGSASVAFTWEAQTVGHNR